MSITIYKYKKEFATYTLPNIEAPPFIVEVLFVMRQRTPPRYAGEFKKAGAVEVVIEARGRFRCFLLGVVFRCFDLHRPPLK